MYDPEKLKEMVDAFAERYRSMMFQAIKSENSNTLKASMEEANAMLSGTVMTPEQIEDFLNKVGFTKKEAGEMAVSVAESRSLWNREKVNEERLRVNAIEESESDKKIKPMQELKKPGFRIRFKAAFGSKEAIKKIRQYNEVFKRRADKVRMTFSDLDERERGTSRAMLTEEQKELRRRIDKGESLKDYSKKETETEIKKTSKRHFWSK